MTAFRFSAKCRFAAPRIAAAAGLAVLLAGCGGSASKPLDKTASALLAPSDVAVAGRTDLTAGVPISGTLEPAVDVKLSAPLTETLAEVLVRDGQRVAKGQVIARFRTSSLEPAAASARAALQLAAADAERYRNLLAEGAVSQRDADAAEAQWRSAQATEAEARKRLDDANVRAPLSGTVVSHEVQSGARVSDGDPMFRLVNTSELEFEASVPSEFAAQVRIGAPVRLDVSGFAHGTISGRVARVNATADAATRQVQVYVRVPNAGGRLVGGLFATGAIVTSEARSAIAVPAAAIRGEEGSRFVYTIARGLLEKHTIESGVRDDGRGLAEVRSGLAAGDSVVTGAIDGLQPGQPVGVAAGDTTRH